MNVSDQFYRAVESNSDGEWHVLDRRQKVISTHHRLDDALARIATVGRSWTEANRRPKRKDVGWALRELQRVAAEVETWPSWMRSAAEWEAKRKS